MFSRTAIMKSTNAYSNKISRLKQELHTADAVVIGAGAGLSTSAGLTYTGERFQKYFGDFIAKYGFRDMYSGGFYPFDSLEEHWAYWSRYIYINRYLDAPKPVYRDLFRLVQEKDYFVLTTNVDHQFQKAGFDKRRLFYTQGDYGLWQCSKPCHQKTYDNKAAVCQMVEAQGFQITAQGPELPDGLSPAMTVPTELMPRCPVCGRPMSMNLRADDTFVEDAGWRRAAGRYQDFLRRHQGLRVVLLELGVGGNTPGIIKFPFWRMAAGNPAAAYACINLGEAYAPEQIASRSICIDADIGTVLRQLSRRAG